MMKGRMAPYVMPTLVHVGRQSVKRWQTSFPQDRQMREQEQKVKREHDTKSPEVEEHPLMDGNMYED